MVYSIQNWLGESESQKKTAATPGYFNVGMACMFPCLSSSTSPLIHPPS